MNILMPVDGSRYTERMLAYVAANNEWLGRKHRFTVLTVVPYTRPLAAAISSQPAGF